MGKKVALFAFNGDDMCFIHVLLNALDMHDRGYDLKLVIEGSATRLAGELDSDAHPLHDLFTKVKDAGLIDCVCRACSGKMGALNSIEEQGLPLCGPMAGHPSIADYMERGYEVLIF
ncbi:MAG TPA: cytoplasmic protein [Euryarchaeota archaeon]|nr:MAG: cytoplasmic protein [Thermoplasmatales archaeon ex4484_6]HHD15174.1 cytoplasmic protein [Euryarchaeota archaeon]